MLFFRKVKLQFFRKWCFLFCSLELVATTYTFNVGTGNWGDASNWTPNGIPGASDTISITSQEVIVNGNFSISTISANDASLNGSETLTIYDQITGTGTLAIGSNLSLASTISINRELTSLEANVSVTGSGGFHVLSGNALSFGTNNTMNYSGATVLDHASTLLLFAEAGLSANSDFTINGSMAFLASATPTLKTISGAGNINFDVSSTLTVGDASSDKMFSGQIHGPVDLQKQGSGVFTLSGSKSYTGSTTVLAGTLALLNGNISSSSSVTVETGATLKGTGSVSTLTIQNGATLYPGNSIGTLTVPSVTFNPTSVFQIEISPSDASKLVVTDLATLAGTVDVVQTGGSYPKSNQYLILTAGSTSGSFSSTITGGIQGHPFILTQVGSNVYLSYNVPSIPVTDLSGNSLTGNALAIANYLNNNSDTAALILLNPLTGSNLQSALDSVSPSRNAFIAYANNQTAFSMSRMVGARIDNRTCLFQRKPFQHQETALLADASDNVCMSSFKAPSGSISGWISGFGALSHQSAADQNPSFNFISEAVLTGVDYQSPTRNLVGGSIGYFHSNLNENNHAGHVNINTLFVALYGAGFIDSLYISPAAWLFASSGKNHRNISFPGFSQTAEATISSLQFLPHLEVGYTQEFCWGSLVPFSSLDWVMNFQKGYIETGASPFNTNQGTRMSSMVKSETGLKITEAWQTDWGAFFLREKVSYVYLNPFQTGILTASFDGTPGQFSLYASSHVQSLGAFSFDALFQFGKAHCWALDLNYEGAFGSRYWTNQLDLTLSKDF